MASEIDISEGRTKVLLVDDDAGVRRALEELLRVSGFDVTGAESGADALHAIEEGLRPDLLISDIVMPGISGVSLAHRLRERFPRLPILMITGFGANILESPDQLPPGAILEEKPFSFAKLLDRIQSLLAVGERSPSTGQPTAS